MRKLLPLTLLLFLSSCGLLPATTIRFDGAQDLPDTAAAIMGRGHLQGLYITHIDGQPLNRLSGPGPTAAIYLPPGEHTFTFTYNLPGYSVPRGTDMEMTKVVEAGHKYRPIDRWVGGKRIRIEILDMGAAYPVECLNSSAYQRKPKICGR